MIAYDAYDNTAYEIKEDWDGDLTQMLYPSLNLTDEEIYYEIEDNYEYTTRFRGNDDLLIQTESDANDLTLYMFRDSFTNTLLPFFANNFGSATFARAVPYSLISAVEENADLVVLEIVERNISELIASVPEMAAPSVDLSEFSINQTTNTCILQTEQDDSLLYVYGALPESMLDTDSHIYVELSDESNTYAFEAFPILDESLSDDYSQDDGFALYIDTEIV